jgi:ABC-type branched-subunit amino acid transport system ATPase component
MNAAFSRRFGAAGGFRGFGGFGGFGAGESLFPLVVLCVIELVDEASKDAFGLLTPEVRDAFHLTNAGILLIIAVGNAAALACTVPVALLADRASRVRLALIGAAFGALFSLGLGLAPTAWLVAVALAGLLMGQAVIFPAHNSLLSDFYPVSARPRVYSAHRAGQAVGAIAGVLLGAALADAFSWRAPFVAFAVPVVFVLAVGMRLREPARGRHELAEPLAHDPRELPQPLAHDPRELPQPLAHDPRELPQPLAHHPPSLSEAWRMVWKIRVLRRTFLALPLLAPAVIGFASLASLQYQKTFHLGAEQRALLVAPAQLFNLIGLTIGAILATRLAARGSGAFFRLLGAGAAAGAAFAALFALAPSLPVAFLANAGIEASLAVIGPGVLVGLSYAIPPRARSIGFSIGALFALPGLALLPAIGALGDHIGLRDGLLLTVPVFLAGSLVVASAGSVIEKDIRNVRTSAAAQAEVAAQRREGRLPLLVVRDLTAGYGGAPVLGGVHLELDEGEIVALLGPNGAGKSTLMRAIAGIVEADDGAVIFDGRDITHMPPDAIARLGIAQVPGGEGVFPTLTVEENLRAAAWSRRDDRGTEAGLIREVLAIFPALAGRRADRAGNLSGGQQQMLTLAMALLVKPRLLLVDELSLGLAPAVVDRLLDSVRALPDRGTAVLLVEQSVNVALSVADRGYVLDGGRVLFSGASSVIEARPDLLGAVYLDRAGPGPTVARRSEADALGGTGAACPADLEMLGVGVRFGGITALDNVSLAARHGEVLGIIGPNGAGKTTLFDVVSGFTRPAAGRVLLHGIDIVRRTPAARARLGLGRSFQDSRLFGGLSVREAVAVALERFVEVADPWNAVLRLPAHQVTEAAVAGRVDEILAFFGLGRLAGKLVGELSTGQRRLVDLAAVLAHQPDVVLLDEPSSGVAQGEVESMLGVLRGVREQLDATLLVVEHDIAFVSELADRLVVLDCGRVLASGPSAEVLAAQEVRDAFLSTARPAGARRAWQRSGHPAGARRASPGSGHPAGARRASQGSGHPAGAREETAP